MDSKHDSIFMATSVCFMAGGLLLGGVETTVTIFCSACRHGERYRPAEPGGRVSLHTFDHDLQGEGMNPGSGPEPTGLTGNWL